MATARQHAIIAMRRDEQGAGGASPSADEAGDLVALVTTDIAGITRGRTIRRAAFESATTPSVGWVPANLSQTPFDIIADPNPWGSRGDLRLRADTTARFRTKPRPAGTMLDFVMSDIVELDGRPWSCCLRSLLRDALDTLEREAGLRLLASFEHEFQIFDAPWQPAPAFSLAALRRADPFSSELVAMLAEAGLEPETVIAEYGRDQYEVTCAPAVGIAAADQAVAIREIVRELVRRRDWRASFAPKTAVDGVGNGVHVHLSFLDAADTPAAYDSSRPGRLSAAAGSFAAGILRHLPALTALTAPSAISFLRLQPHHWSASYTWLGERDREATLRICPTHAADEAGRARQFNLEYRAADATASPYLVLAALVRAGLEGLRARLPAPPLVDQDPGSLTEAERERLGLRRLPTSLADALAALEADAVARSWFAPELVETYLGMKRAELALVEGLEGDALCARYAAVY